MSLDDVTRAHLADSYPHNHDYRVVGEKLKPRWKLMRRWRRMEPLWPRAFDSFLDVGCSKGFFVLQAARRGADPAARKIPRTTRPALYALPGPLHTTKEHWGSVTLVCLG
mgnify:CR=1 FL=1